MDPNKVDFTITFNVTSVYFPCKCGERFDRNEAKNYCPNCGAKLGPLQQMGGLSVRKFLLNKLLDEKVTYILLQARDEQEAYVLLEREFYPPTEEATE